MLGCSFDYVFNGVGAGSGIGGFIVLVGVVLALVLVLVRSCVVVLDGIGSGACSCSPYSSVLAVGLPLMFVCLRLGPATALLSLLSWSFVIGAGVAELKKKLLYNRSRVLWHSPVVYRSYYCSEVSSFDC